MFHEVISNQVLNYKFRLLRFKTKNKGFTFEPGQFTVIKIDDAIFRCYSIYSLPHELPFWQIFVDIIPGGPGSQFLKNLAAGDKIETTKISGAFTLKKDKSQTVVFAATGCGLAALKPMIEKLLKQKDKPKIFLLWGLRHKKDIVLKDLLEDWRKKNPCFSYEIVLSQPKSDWKGKNGHITPHVIKLAKILPQDKTAIYLCGGSEFVEESQKFLLKIKFPQKRIYFEKCY